VGPVGGTSGRGSRCAARDHRPRRPGRGRTAGAGTAAPAGPVVRRPGRRSGPSL